MALGASLVREITRFRAAETAVAAAFAVMISTASGVPVEAAQRAPPKIDSFGPYKVGMPLADAKKADPNAKEGDCGELAEDRRCLILKAAVFEEPAVIYAVLDEKREHVDKVIAKLDPKLSRRRAYRCIRLSEKVFALLVVVYGSKYKQQYDENRRPLPAVAWDGELEGRLIFRANCKSQDEGTPLITVVPRRGEGSSVAADLSPTPTPNKDTESAADLLQGQKPGAKQVPRSGAVSALAESARKAEQQVRRTAPVAPEPPSQQAKPTDPVILGAGPGGLSIDSAPITPRPAPSRSQIDIDDPSMLPRAAPRTPVSVTLLPGSSPAAPKPSPEPAAPSAPPVSPESAVPVQPPAVVASKPAPAAVPKKPSPAAVRATTKPEPAPVTGSITKIEGEPEPTPTTPETAPVPTKPVNVARTSPNVPLSRTTQARTVLPSSGTAADIPPEADQSTYVDADDDEGEQSEPVREMPVFAQDGTATSTVPAAVQASRAGAGSIQAPAVATTTPAAAPSAQTPAAAPPRDPVTQVASAAIPKSPKPAKPATGQPRSLIAARDTARPAANPAPRTYSAEKPKAAAAVSPPGSQAAAAPAGEQSEAAADLPDLDDEPTGTVAVSADRAPAPAKSPATAAAVGQSPTQAPAAAAPPKPLEKRVASGQPLRLTRNAETLPDRARVDTPPSSGGVKAVPSAPAKSVQPAPSQQGTPVTRRPEAPSPGQTATIETRTAPAPARTQSAPSSAPVSRKTSDGIEDFGYQLDLRIERQKTRWKAPVPPARPWRTLGNSSLRSGTVQGGVADTAVLDEPSVVIPDVDNVADAPEKDGESDISDGVIGIAAGNTPSPADHGPVGIEHRADDHRTAGDAADAAGTAVLDEPGFAEEGQTPTENARPQVPPVEPTGTAALDEPLVSFAVEKPNLTPTTVAEISAAPQTTTEEPAVTAAPVPPKRPWINLTDAAVAAYVTPAPVPAARPSPKQQPQPSSEPEQKLAEQPDGSIVDIGSSSTGTPDIDSKSFGRRTDILDHL